MAASTIPLERISRSGLLAFAVFVLGAMWTAHAFTRRVNEQERQLAAHLREAGDTYHTMLQRRLAPYAASIHGVAAFVSASRSTTPAEFGRYVKRSRLLERLSGIHAIGFLPKVPASELAAFEAGARQFYPGYRVKQANAGASYVFPVLYIHARSDAIEQENLRGLDFSSVPERLNAMRIAAATDYPAATRAHRSLVNRGELVVLTLAPVRSEDRAVAAGIESTGGFVYSVMLLDEVLERLRASPMGKIFDVELYEGAASPRTLLYDVDQTRQALTGNAVPHTQTGQVEFADQRWSIYMFPKRAYLEAHKAGYENWVFAAFGLLASLLAALAVSGISRSLAARRAGAEIVTRFDAFFGDHPFSVYTLDPDRRFVNVNKKAAQQVGLPREAIVGQPVERFVKPDNHATMQQQFERALSGRATVYVETVVDGAGNEADFSVLLIPIRSGARVIQVLGIAENITERRRAEQELAASRQMLQFILDNVPQLIFWKDTDSVFLGANRNLLDHAGLATLADLVGRTDYDFAWKQDAPRFQEDDKAIMASGQPRLHYQEPILQEDGVHWLQTSKVPLKDDSGQVIGILGVSEDITERKRMEEELVRRANYDSLTGLPNRAYFYSELERAVKRARRTKRDLALMYFDIDHFKQINDSRGHGAGDAVIREFSARVRGVVRDSDMLARLGGDEFVLVVEQLVSRADASVLAEKLVEAVRAPLVIEGAAVHVTTSLGIAFLEPGMNPDQLVSAADAAMYMAKQAGRSCYRVAPATSG